MFTTEHLVSLVVIYPWGSGGDENSRNRDFLGYVKNLQKQGLTETEIASGIGMTTTQLRAQKSISINQQKQAGISQALRLKDTGMSNVAIAKEMNLNESSVRSLLAPGAKDKNDVLQATAKMLREEVATKGLIDVGVGVERSSSLGISREKLNTALAILKQEGYVVHYVKVEQLGTGLQTTRTVLSKPDVPYSEVFKNRGEIKLIDQHTEDGGRTFVGIDPPVSISSTRVDVKWSEDGGAKADGVIYVRPGVDDVSLGKSRYAQVRIAVDGTHYLKGMAMYKDDLPPGVDLEFHTSKPKKANKLDAMKVLSNDPDYPFGAIPTRQHGVMNILNEEGNWDTWKKALSSQMLSKQSPSLAKTQLDMMYDRKKSDLDEIMSLTNPAVRKKLLEAHADDADSASVHLKAAALPRTASHVILPINSLKETEIYAPNYRDGELLVLIRHPHGGPFEIPQLVVNNKNKEAKSAIGNATDAVGIHSKVAERLSGADFDGDTILVIPNNSGKIKTAPALAGLKNFDPKRSYPAYEGMPTMSVRTKQIEMGKISNLITDMTIRGATSAELAAAVRHSMTVIDAEKHHLNYKQSAIDNSVSTLKAKYQDGSTAGAATLISRAGSNVLVPERKPRSAANGGPVDKATGKKMYEPTGRSYISKKTGKLIVNSVTSKKLVETQDAHTLSSGTPIETVYGDHSNKLKALANQARKEAVNTKTLPYSSSAKAAYLNEVASLNAKLNIALKNAPLERQAQTLANAVVTAKVRANPDMEPASIKKLKFKELENARIRTNAKKQQIEITDSEWNAIQSGGISNSKLTKILDNSDLDQIKRLATPKSEILMTSSKKSRAEAMLRSGYTQAEVADAIGVSLTTLKTGIK